MCHSLIFQCEIQSSHNTESTYSQIPVEVIRVSVDPIPLLVFKKQSGWFQCNPGEVQYILMTVKEMCIGVVTYIYFSIYLFFIHKKREKKKTEDVSSIHCYMVHL